MSSATLATLNVAVQAQTAGFDRGMQRVRAEARSTSSSLAGMSRGTSQLTGAFREFQAGAQGSVSSLARIAASGGPVIAMAAAAAAAYGAFTKFAVPHIKAADEAAKVQRRLEAVLQSTGHAAGFTGKQLDGYATHLAGVSHADNGAIKSATAVLATFRNVRGEAFTGAMQAAMDMAGVLDEDVSTSMSRLGRALNDPIDGIAKLKKEGVEFSDAQLKQIEALAKSGNLLAAQKVMLAQVAATYAGGAAAARTWAGEVEKADSNLSEQIGNWLNSFDIVQMYKAQRVRMVESLRVSFGGEVVDPNASRVPVGAAQPPIDLHAEQVAELAQRFREQATAVGLSNDQLAIHQLELAGASEQQIQHLRMLAAEADSLNHLHQQQERRVQSTAALREQIEAIGKTASEIELLRFQVGYATEWEIKHYRALLAKRDALMAQHQLATDVTQLNEKLREQAETYGLSARQADIYRLAQRGATEETLRQARALDQQITAMEQAQQQAQRIAQAAAQTRQQTQSPVAQYRQRIAELREQLAAGEIDRNTARRAALDAREQMVSELERNRPELDRGLRGAAALERGTASAFSAINAAGAKSEAQKMIGKQEEQLKELKELNRQQREQIRQADDRELVELVRIGA